MALRWEDVDLERGVIRVQHSWDVREGVVAPKSRAGTRTVPVARLLREYFAAQTLRSQWVEGLVFGRSPTAPSSR